MQSGIYQIHNSVNGKRYVGSATCLRVRRNEHWCGLRNGKHHNRHLQNAVSKHGLDAFRFEPLLICDPKDLLFYEQRALDVLNPEYNLARVAGNTLGTKRTVETRAKIAAKAIGRQWSDEARVKVSATLKGRKMSAEFRQKLIGNQRAKGLKHTDEWKAANSARHMGRKRPKSPEYRAKIAATLRGRKATPEHRANQSAAQRAMWKDPVKRAQMIEKKRATMLLKRQQLEAKAA